MRLNVFSIWLLLNLLKSEDTRQYGLENHSYNSDTNLIIVGYKWLKLNPKAFYSFIPGPGESISLITVVETHYGVRRTVHISHNLTAHIGMTRHVMLPNGGFVKKYQPCLLHKFWKWFVFILQQPSIYYRV